MNTVIHSLKNVTFNNMEEFGKFYYQSGNYYIGPLTNGLPNGKGKKYFNNGNFYEGAFINGKANGYGKGFYGNGGHYYIGQWKDNMRHRKGIQYYKNGNVMLDGTFLFDKLCGYGKSFSEEEMLSYGLCYCKEPNRIY